MDDKRCGTCRYWIMRPGFSWGDCHAPFSSALEDSLVRCTLSKDSGASCPAYDSGELARTTDALTSSAKELCILLRARAFHGTWLQSTEDAIAAVEKARKVKE